MGHKSRLIEKFVKMVFFLSFLLILFSHQVRLELSEVMTKSIYKILKS